MKLQNLPIIRIFSRWFESANSATEGILHAARTQPHIKFYLIVSFILLFTCFMIGVNRFEFITIALITILVIVAEMFNSALETIVDMKSPENSDIARIAKDVAAGAVLICAVGAFIIGYLILWPYFIRIIDEGFWIAKHTPENIAVLAVIIIMLLVIMFKAYMGKGHPLKGGFPSGHAAIAFSIWISITFMSRHQILIFSTLLFAIAISLSRLQRKIHTILDIAFGIIFGSGITLLLFWIFY